MKPSIWFMIANSYLFTPEGLAELVFLGIILVTITGAVIATNSARLIRSVTGLAVCFIGVAGIYYYLNSPFLAVMEMLIYVGAVCVTIVFAVMLADPEAVEQVGKQNVLAGAASFGLGALIFFALYSLGSKTAWIPSPVIVNDGSIENVGSSLLTTYSMVFEVISLVLLVAIIGALVLGRSGRGR